MPRESSKFYSRKLNSVSQIRIQSDNLLREDSNRPSTAKSAGTIGKWGVISYTSLRSSNLNTGREDITNSKRIRLGYGNQNSQDSSEDGDKLLFDHEEMKVVAKRKKFFKSHNVDLISGDLRCSTEGKCNNSTHAIQSGKDRTQCDSTSEPSTTTDLVSSGDLLNEQIEALDLFSRSMTTAPIREDNKAPTVVKMFKGTSSLVNDVKESVNVPPPSKSPTETQVLNLQSTRRCHVKVSDTWSSLLHNGEDNQTYVDISPAEKSKRVVKDNIAILNSIASSSPLGSAGCKSEVKSSTSEVTVRKYVWRDASVKSVLTDNLEAPRNKMKLNSEENGLDYSKMEAFPSEYGKLLNEEKDSCKTIVDSTEINNTSKCLIKEPKGACKTMLHSFTNSEGSNIIVDQINAMASPQGESKLENQMRDKSNEEKFKNIAPNMELMQETVVPEMECTSRKAISSNVSKLTRSSATKMGSIFKSRSLVSDRSKKFRALYKHKWVGEDTGGFSQHGEKVSGEGLLVKPTADAKEEFKTPKFVRVVTWSTSNAAVDEEAKVVTSIKCNKTAKEYFTVIRNVKKAHQIQESGEFQEFNDDVEYILDALQNNNSIGTRCLSAITLASKCMSPDFRMHVKAHGAMAKFFHALHDAAQHQSLALCTAMVMFVLSQNHLKVDLDHDSVELLVNLLESDASHHNDLEFCNLSITQLHKNNRKVRELCAEIQSQGHAKHFNLDNITAGQLAMETLLSLMSHCAGQQFKGELRELGGLEHVVKVIHDCCAQVGDYIVEWSKPFLDKLSKLDRCLKGLENVTYQNEENQMYLLKYENGTFIDTLARLYNKCNRETVMHPIRSAADKESLGAVTYELLLTILKVLMNLAHNFSNKATGSSLVGKMPGIIEVSLHVLLQVPSYVPEEKKFDLVALVLIFLINLVEHSTSNRKLLFDARAPPEPDAIFYNNDDKRAVEVLISLFYQHKELASMEGIKTDAILDGKNDTEPESEPQKLTEELIEETVAKLLQKAGCNMEHTFIGAYVVILIGYLITDNKEFEMFIREYLPQKNFSSMISVLEKVYKFMILAPDSSSSRGIAQTRHIINCLEQSDARASNMTTSNSEDVHFQLDMLHSS